MINVDLISRFKAQVVSFCVLFLLISVMPIQADNHHRKLINCELHDGACVQHIGDTEITLEVTPRPVKAMEDLVLKVSLSDNGKVLPESPTIDLNMPKMNMGKNRVMMKAVGPKVYEGKGIIVRCASGHRVWKATVTVPNLGKADFIFDVVY